MNIDEINNEYYNAFGGTFDSIPFKKILPDLLLKYVAAGKDILEIGSGAGALAAWLADQGYKMTCLEPAPKPALSAKLKGLKVLTTTIQNFRTDQQYDIILAISSLIHVPKRELPSQLGKIAKLLKPKGLFFVSFIEGSSEGFEDPTGKEKLRYFAKWPKEQLDQLLSSYFTFLESHPIYKKEMDCTFLLNVARKI